MRSMPCGADAPDCSFSGTLLNRSDYLEPERTALFGRYGADPSDWTVVGLVTRYADAPGDDGMVDLSAFSPDQFDRLALEGLVAALLKKLETLGVADAPRWPSISITPLGIYRGLPAA